MSATQTCPQCGAELRGDALEGLCPDCLGKLALESEGQRPEVRGQRSDGSNAASEVGRDVPIAPVGAIQPPVSSIEHPTTRFGDYELLSEIAHGGMGVVFKARQVSLNRTVAVKMIRAGPFASKEFVHRFRVEASAAAVLQHPNIVAVHEVGVHEGQHFFSMDYVAGQNLAQLVREGPLPANRAARYVQKIAEAIHYAHQSGILHRDLKPSNVLIDQNDQPRITDFGLAKRLGGTRSTASQTSEVRDEVELVPPESVTLTGEVMGTPGYMPPEQASGNRGAVKAWSDIYSLGAILYHLLTGRAPFAAGSLEETLNQVLHQDPISVRLLNPAVPRDLNTICLKCLEKEPAKRYASANVFAEELTRFLNHEPILARPISTVGKAARWCRRKPMAASALALLVVVAVGSPIAAFRINRARQAEQHERERAEESAVRADAAATRLEIERAELLFASDGAPSALAYLARLLRRQPTNEVVAERILSALSHRNFCLPLFPLRHEGIIQSARFSPDGQLIVTASADKTARVWDGHTGQPIGEPLQHDGEVSSAQFSADSGRIATASKDGRARIWDTIAGTLLCELLGHKGPVWYAEFSGDGQHVITASQDTTARIWNSRSGQQVGEPLRCGNPVLTAGFNPDGSRLSTDCGRTDLISIWDARTFKKIAAAENAHSNRPGFPGVPPQFSLDGTRVLVSGGGYLKGASLCNALTGKQVGKRFTQESRLNSARLSPENGRVVTAGEDTIARVWSSDGKPLTPPLRHNNHVNFASFSPNGLLVITAGRDGNARLWDAQTGIPLTEPIAHQASVGFAQLNVSGRRLLTVSGEPGLAVSKVAWVWDVRLGLPFNVALPHSAHVDVVAFSPDGQKVATASYDGTARAWEVATGQPVTAPLPRASGLLPNIGEERVAFSPDSHHVLASLNGPIARLWDLTGKLVREFEHHTNIVSLAFSPDGKRVLAGGASGRIRVWDVTSGNIVSESPLPLLGNFQAFSRFSPGGDMIVSGTSNLYSSTAQVWEPATGKLVALLKHQAVIFTVAFSADGERIVTASRDQTARIWMARTGKLAVAPLLHEQEVRRAEFSGDGSKVATMAGNQALLWDSRTGQPAAPPLRLDGRVISIRFSDDGRRLVTADYDGVVRVWDSRSGLPVSEPMKHEATVRYAELSPDGRRVASACRDGTARIWDLPPAASTTPAWLAELAEACAGQRINSQGMSENVPPEKLYELRQQVKESAAANRAWVEWFFADSATRPISPLSSNTTAVHVQRLLKFAAREVAPHPEFPVDVWERRRIIALRQATRLAPDNALALAQLALAEFNTNVVVARHIAQLDWQSRYATMLAPNQPEVWWARAEVCERLGKPADAVQAMERAITLTPTNPAVWNAWGERLEKMNRPDEALVAFTKAIELIPRRSDVPGMFKAQRLNRARLFRRSNRLGEAAKDIAEALNIPPRNPQWPSTLADLSPFYNHSLDETPVGMWMATMSSVPRGLQKFGGVDFDVRALIQLWGSWLQADTNACPPAINGIKVHGQARQMHFLAASVYKEPDGAAIGKFVMHYVDGMHDELPLVYGENIRYLYTAGDPNEVTKGQLAWPATDARGEVYRLFKLTWTNLRPDVAVESIDFVSTMTQAGPFLVAITTEP